MKFCQLELTHNNKEIHKFDHILFLLKPTPLQLLGKSLANYYLPFLNNSFLFGNLKWCLKG